MTWACLGRLRSVRGSRRTVSQGAGVRARRRDGPLQPCQRLGWPGQFDGAIEHYQTALNGLADHVQAYNNFGIALANLGRLDEAIVQFRQGLKIEPEDVGLHSNLANALMPWAGTLKRGHYQTALKLRPNHLETQKNLAWLLATCPQASLRNGAEAIELAQRASRLCGENGPMSLTVWPPPTPQPVGFRRP